MTGEAKSSKIILHFPEALKSYIQFLTHHWYNRIDNLPQFKGGLVCGLIERESYEEEWDDEEDSIYQR